MLLRRSHLQNPAFENLQQLIDDGYADMDCSLIIRNIDPHAPGVPQQD